MDRLFQALLLFSITGLSWLLMLVFHEAGHVLQGWLTGAHVTAVILPPFGISRTDFAANPHPLLAAWGGAFWGCLLPLAMLAIARCLAEKRRTYLLAWLAGFCLVANGAYLLGGAILTSGADDGGVILHNGGSRWQLIAFGLVAIAGGLYLWNGLGPYFGFGPDNGHVDRKTAVSVTAAWIVLVCVEALTAN